MSHEFSASRYDAMSHRRCGRSGLLLPLISLGAHQTFGGYRDAGVARDCLFRAFDMGITHFDFANNYGRPPGNAETVCGSIIKEMPRDELIISSKAGYTMWPGPYGDGGSKKYIIASCDQSLKRMGLEYFDIFYHHRPDSETPLEETLGALDLLVCQGKALYIGISNYSGSQFAQATQVCERHGLAPITVVQPRYNLRSRGIEWDLLPQTERAGSGVMAFGALAGGLLSDKYLRGDIPPQSRAAQLLGKEWVEKALNETLRPALVSLNEMALARGQSLAQMALAWVLRLPAVTSALIGASSVRQIEENVAALGKLDFTEDELRRIDELMPRNP